MELTKEQVQEWREKDYTWVEYTRTLEKYYLGQIEFVKSQLQCMYAENQAKREELLKNMLDLPWSQRPGDNWPEPKETRPWGYCEYCHKWVHPDFIGDGTHTECRTMITNFVSTER